MLKYKPRLDLERHREPLLAILREVALTPNFSRQQLSRLLKTHPKDGIGLYSRDELIEGYRAFAGTAGLPPYENTVLELLRLKPVRSSSGVTPVTVLTKPFPCPGECIFCPNDVRMPKSYLADEPGAQRAEQNGFDPYLQTYTRLQAYYNVGHPTEKIEVIILGGTWSFYPESYQIWFVKRIFDALHDFGSGINRCAEVEAALKTTSQFQPAPMIDAPFMNPIPNVALLDGRHLTRNYNQVVQTIYRDEMYRSRDMAQAIADGKREQSPSDEYATWDELEAAHRENESAACRCVGLVVETRPDHISVEEVLRIRRLGCTKVQIGFQSLNDDVLKMNRRGHNVAATRRAVKLLRQAGFKIHAHWMPNLYGSSPDADIEDYRRMFADADFRPDELKVYPCSLIESAELMQRYEDGSWHPYTQAELLYVLAECFRLTPEYCRLTRVIRDIPGTDIVAGNEMTNFRQLVENELTRHGERSSDIRAREIGQRTFDPDTLRLDEVGYASSCGDEIFLQYITPERYIAGFLRLALPDRNLEPLTPELGAAAIIREVHVYGQALGLGESGDGRAQHAGLGTQLVERALEIAAERGYQRVAVISAVGTREYYRKRGFVDDGAANSALYQWREC
ncbi:MAG: tRNA uridine(34) 5-carboxymethylaminomethyl modification radical SAM/GNAT enzyme Elp3 [Burkholderiales bacterium]|nr:tRNA uridine(34) 5-carboxymethylaminomethyl modification radical SAM/GNAT enzyme Elp3 [Anaerolineae bacterium]